MAFKKAVGETVFSRQNWSGGGGHFWQQKARAKGSVWYWNTCMHL